MKVLSITLGNANQLVQKAPLFPSSFFSFFFSVCLCICFRINGTDCCTFPFILGIRYAAHRFMSTLYICHIQLIMLSTISPQKKGDISIFVKL
jgi:hypothetical protein